MKSIVVSASENYFLGLKALLNSFEHCCFPHMPQPFKFYVLDYDLKPDQVDFVKTKAFCEIARINGDEFPPPYNKNRAWATKIPRFKFAAEELDDVCMMLDADMFFASDMSMYFDLADHGFIIGGSNGSNIFFGENYAEKWGEPINHFCHKTIGSVPTILDLDRYRKLWASIYESKFNMKPFCDFELLNIMLFKEGLEDKILPIPSQQVTGLHHFQLRPDTRVIEKMGRMLTSDGLEVLMCHGKYWNPGYGENMMRTMKKYAQRLNPNYTEKNPIEIGAQQSLNLIQRKFDQWIK